MNWLRNNSHVVAYLIFTGLFIASLWLTTHQAEQSRADLKRETTKINFALCELRYNIERRVQTSEQFLVDHPEGIPGIPKSTIVQGITDQKENLKALTILSCPPR
jgi:hypothetical protein